MLLAFALVVALADGRVSKLQLQPMSRPPALHKAHGGTGCTVVKIAGIGSALEV